MRISNDGLRLSAWTRQEDHSAESLSENASPWCISAKSPSSKHLSTKTILWLCTCSRSTDQLSRRNRKSQTPARGRRVAPEGVRPRCPVPACTPRAGGRLETRPLSYKRALTALTKADLNSADQEQSNGVWHAMVSVKTPHGGTLLGMGGPSRSPGPWRAPGRQRRASAGTG